MAFVIPILNWDEPRHVGPLQTDVDVTDSVMCSRFKKVGKT